MTRYERAEYVARLFHETYERLAPAFSYETRKASAVEWDKVPSNNRSLMIEVVDTLMAAGVVFTHVDDYDALCSTFCCAHRHALSCPKSKK